MKKYYLTFVLLIAYVCVSYSFCCNPKETHIKLASAAPTMVVVDEIVEEHDSELFHQEAKPAKVFPRIECPLDDNTQQMIVDKCEYYNVDFAFTMAVIFNESSFNPNADSGSSVGLMQINRCNHMWLSEVFGVTSTFDSKEEMTEAFFDPEFNVTAGLYMLRELFEKYEDPALVLMSYNMGEHKALQMWNDGVYSTAYTRAVFSKAEEYNAQIEEYINFNQG